MTRVLYLLGLGPVALLAACGAKVTPPPAVVYQPVDRLVAVPCLRAGQRPLVPKRLVQDQPVPPPTLTEMVGRLRAKLNEWEAYGQTADPLLQLCETLPVPKGGDAK